MRATAMVAVKYSGKPTPAAEHSNAQAPSTCMLKKSSAKCRAAAATLNCADGPEITTASAVLPHQAASQSVTHKGLLGSQSGYPRSIPAPAGTTAGTAQPQQQPARPWTAAGQQLLPQLLLLALLMATPI